MKLQLVRNATIRLHYAGRLMLIDPYLSPRHTLPAYAGRSPNPLVDLPCPPEAVAAGVELVLVSHLHTDHFDPPAQALLDKDLPLICRPGHDERIRTLGFRQVTALEQDMTWSSIRLRRTPGRHGTSPAVLAQMGEVCGFFLEAPGEPRFYWAGDTVWTEEVAGVIKSLRPEVIVTHSGGAVWGEGELIIMDAAQTIQVCRAAPEALVIATHLEALDHCLSGRDDLAAAARAAGFGPDRLRIPADGETIEIGEPA